METERNSATFHETAVTGAVSIACVLVTQHLLLCAQATGGISDFAAWTLIALGFAPWLYIVAVAKALSNAAIPSPKRRPTVLECAEAICLLGTIVSESIISWCLIYWSAMPGPVPLSREAVVISYAAPFLLGIPGCFAFAWRQSRICRSPKAGLLPGALLAMGLMHPFTVLPTVATLGVLLGGPDFWRAHGPAVAWMYSAQVGSLIALGALKLLSSQIKQTIIYALPESRQV